MDVRGGAAEALKVTFRQLQALRHFFELSDHATTDNNNNERTLNPNPNSLTRNSPLTSPSTLPSPLYYQVIYEDLHLFPTEASELMAKVDDFRSSPPEFKRVLGQVSQPASLEGHNPEPELQP